MGGQRVFGVALRAVLRAGRFQIAELREVRCTEPVNGCRICIVGSTFGALTPWVVVRAAETLNGIPPHTPTSYVNNGLQWRTVRPRAVAMPPGWAGINVRKTARYAGKDRDPLQLTRSASQRSDRR